jgi:hypothetical protein
MLDRRQLGALAAQIGVSAAAVRKWWQRGAVPHRWRMAILRAAAARGIDARYDDMGALRAPPSASRK